MPEMVKRVRALARERASGFLVFLAFVGVPLAVPLLTGGLSTMGFWMKSLLMIPAVLIGVTPLGILLILLLSPLLFLLDKLFPQATNTVVEKGAMVFYVLFGAIAFALQTDLSDTSVRLPFPDPWKGAGALLVIAAAVASMSGLLWLSIRFQVPKPKRSAPTPAPTPVPVGLPDWWPDEPDEEFWDFEPVIGWRAWGWTGSHLRGVVVEWRAEVLVAGCPAGHNAPQWDHSCGIYAFKGPSDARMAIPGAPVVGRVEMWGSVIEHEGGYRCSHARITHLWATNDELAGAVRARYPNVSVSVGSPTLSRKD